MTGPARGVKAHWVIRVCRQCGRKAVWPFCEHRQEWLDSGQEGNWCENINVTGTWHPLTTEEQLRAEEQ